KLLFWPIHNRFGGKLRLLVAGASARPEEVQRAFHELGFDLAEGYGLTEASPVLSVSVLGNKLRSGTVGPPLPGVEIRIENPNGDGVGEVLAKGPNVLAGYLDEPAATPQGLADGMLRTVELGRRNGAGILAVLWRLGKATAAATQRATEPAGSDAWLYDLLADLAQRPRGSVSAQTRLVADLGFDSLLIAELTVALEKAGVKAPSEAESATIA